MASSSITAPTKQTRFYDRRDIKSPVEQFAADLCRTAGVVYKGIQPGFDNGKGKVIPAQVLVDNAYRSTLCIPITELTVERILYEVAVSNAAWRGAR